MRQLKLCIYFKSTIVRDCVEYGLAQLFRVLGHTNIYYGAVYARDNEIAQIIGTFLRDLLWCISYYEI